jgi:hypothetical protein
MFGKVSCKSLLLSFLAIAAVLVPLSMASSEVYAQSCRVFQFDANYAPTVAPGQTFHVTSTISLACYQWRTYYGGRVDIVDPASNTVLSTSTFEIGWMPTVTATVSNSATAPQTQGSWDLQLILYIFEGGGIVESINRPINIQVGAQSVSTTQQTTLTVSTTSSKISTTTQTSYATGTTTSTLTPAVVVSILTNTVTTTDNSMSTLYGMFVAVLLVLLGATVFLLLSRPTTNQPRINGNTYRYGNNLKQTDRFCGKCGRSL